MGARGLIFSLWCDGGGCDGQALIDVSVHLGFPRQMAEKLVLQTVMGTTLYAMRSGG
jgi:hypothetical protein